MENFAIGNEKAVKIKAKLIKRSPNSGYYNCEGDKVWIADSCCEFNEEEGTMLLKEWLFKYLEKEGKL